MNATIDITEIATNVRAEIAAMPDRLAGSALYSAREIDTITWMLGRAAVTHTANAVTVRFAGGKAFTAHSLGTALLDRASEHLPLEAGGEIVQIGDYTFTLKF
jgi:hypothetical protein